MASPEVQLPDVVYDVLPMRTPTGGSVAESPSKSIHTNVASLASLPQELLDKIARYAVVDPAPITIQCDRTIKSATRARYLGGLEYPLGLAMVSRRLYKASIWPFYEQNRFIVRLKQDNCPLMDLFEAPGFKVVTSITLSISDPGNVNFLALVGLVNLHRLKIFISKYNDHENWNNARLGMLEVCRTLHNLDHTEIVAQSPKFTSLNSYSFDSQNWSSIEHLVNKMRREIRMRDLDACVHLREILLYERHIERQFYDNRPLKKKIRLYAAPGVFIFVSQDTLDERTGNFVRWQRDRRRLLATTAIARPAQT